jgi:large subunit ribosomal protein L23
MSKKSVAKKPTITAAMYDVIRRPVVTEKATMASEFGKVVFDVADSATKVQVKKAVEALFEVKVTKVNTLNTKGKEKRFRGMVGQRSGYKKAVVTLAEGQTIDAMAGVK